jgi:hypothetical protein
VERPFALTPSIIRHASNISFVVALIVATGCNQTNTPSAAVSKPKETRTILAEGDVSNEVQQKLLAAKDELFKQLSGRLSEVLGQQGPAGAIQVCSQEARSIADAVGRKHHVRIGRVGVRLRNEDNQAPDWAAEFVRTSLETPKFVRLSDQTEAALLPIKLQPQCLMCHGPKDSLSSEVKQRLAKLYPNDKATDFKEGELRGWFWVETLATN